MNDIRRLAAIGILAIVAILLGLIGGGIAKADHGSNFSRGGFSLSLGGGHGFSGFGVNRFDSDFERGFEAGLRASSHARVLGNSDFARGFRAGQLAANDHRRGRFDRNSFNRFGNRGRSSGRHR